MDQFSVEKSVPYYDQIYYSIKQMIMQGVFKPGERIYEAKMARDFKVSRSPVREAVRALEKEGLLFIDDKSRVTVYKPTLGDMEDIYQCRIILESLAAKLAARLASNRELKEIETTLVQTRKYIEEKNPQRSETIIALNSRFHDLIIQFSQNKRLQKQLYDLRSLSYYYRVLNFQGKNRDWTIFNEHKGIFEAIKERDEEKAGARMSDHVTHDMHNLIKMLDGKLD
ncbi:GntR family transcriptional regulator [Ferviditalea candida]|uniref:GntR family transcriptional regulator n=1 Tax=Ferviditalea candida TaxID=3108399 RepID=A0ABU5ZM88_9BACL|nr:GntR family transcriptional regulator [Paenibacillaceae bacterium T2]